MSGIFGLLGYNDTDRVFVSTIGQQVVYDAISALTTRYNLELGQVLNAFVERSTSDYKWRYKLPGGGRLSKMSGLAAPAEVRATGQWDVAFPLEDYGAGVGGGRVNIAYMTLQDLNRHLDTVMVQDMNTVRFEILRRLFNDTQRTFIDPLYGSLAVEGFANGDSVVYPPVIGIETEATEDHYTNAGYAQSSISNTNNPCVTVRDELEEHFGQPTGGSNIVAFFAPAARPYLEALTAFDSVPDYRVRPGANADVPFGLPANIPGTIIGRSNGVWCSVWRWIPDAYTLAIHLDVPKPLIQRVDLPETGLPTGLALVARDEKFPLETSYWEHRFGFGAGNRLNGAFMFISASAFAIPSGYTW